MNLKNNIIVKFEKFFFFKLRTIHIIEKVEGLGKNNTIDGKTRIQINHQSEILKVYSYHRNLTKRPGIVACDVMIIQNHIFTLPILTVQFRVNSKTY